MKEDKTFIDHLNTLRDTHRLAIHMWEDEKKFHFPKLTWDYFSAAHPSEIPSRLAQRKIPLLSMSLLPSMASQKSMVPYDVKQNVIGGMSYLVDLDQEQDYPPKVVRVNVTNLGTGNNVYKKILKLGQKTGIQPLDELYNPYESHTDRWLEKIATEQNSQYTKMQLNALGTHMEDIRRSASPTLDCNEIVVAAHAQHIAAICVPINTSAHPPAWYMPLLTLSGALAGLQHLKKGYNLPVVYYHVSPPMQGTFALLGRTKEQLIKKALGALATLNVNEISDALTRSIIPPNASRDLQKNVIEYLGIDIAKSLSEQRSVLEQLRKELGTGIELH